MKHTPHGHHFSSLGAALLILLLIFAPAPFIGQAAAQAVRVAPQRSLPAPTPPADGAAPDALENNWNSATATPIAVGVIYDLNFVCPVAWGCAGGDHDYLRLTVKRGLRYLIATFDLGPGVDTELDLFWGSEEVPIASNDDARPSHGFLSVIRWVAPADGTAIIRVAPRTGGNTPVVSDAHAGAYRFAVALAGSDLAHTVEERIAAQTGGAPAQPGRRSETLPSAPTPTRPSPVPNPPPAPPLAPASPTPAAATAGASSSGTTVRAPSGLTSKGAAIVSAHDTAFRIAPNPSASLIATLPNETLVTLTGQYNGLWVSVTTADSVLPGWVLGTDLRRLALGQATPVITSTTTLPTTTLPTSSPATPVATPSSATSTSSAVSIRPIAPLPAAPPPAPLPRSTLTISVTVRSAPILPAASSGRPSRTPTPAPGRAVSGMRVQLVDAFGQLLAEGLTGTDGHVALAQELAANQRIAVRLPAAGIELAVDPRQPDITIAIPTGDLP